ncbi:unnamed protein product [Trichobilharzia szidati]|nr:unnamed protein product [Trichobilharzia szidati]
MTDVDIKIIKRTQETLGKIIKKPVLTEKLLGRPPFRFLHDICTAVIRTTGLMKGLYNQEELNADNVKDKDKKLAFLQKLVDFLAVVHGRPIPIRIMSIVAGKEAEKTNEMLCLLAEAVHKGVNNEDCVARVLQGNVNQKVDKKQESEAKQQKEKPNTVQSPMDSQKREVRKSRRDDNRDEVKNNKSGGGSLADSDKNFGTSKKTTAETVSVEKGDNGRETPSRCDSRTLDKSQEESSTAIPSNAEISSQQSLKHRPVSAKGQRVIKDAPPDTKISVNQGENKPDPVSNPRLAPPRPKRSTDLGVGDSPKQTGMMAGLIISESQQDTDEDENEDSKFVIEEIVGGISGEISTNQWSNKIESEENQEHGGLVTKILQSKKEFEDANLINKEKSKLQTKGSNEMAKECEKALLEKEINRLCNSLQSLSRSAIPLSKLMDFIQEDLETMQQEFERWRNENNSLKSQLKQQESLTQSCIEPLKAQLEELEQFEKEKERAIAKCKTKILHNNERIENLLFRSLEKVF